MSRLKKYLEAKPESEYTLLDKFFRYHIDGRIKPYLKDCGCREIYITSTLREPKTLDVSFIYQNMDITCFFFEKDYYYSIKKHTNIIDVSDISEEDDESKNEHPYEENFSLERFFERLFDGAEKHPEFEDISEKLASKKKYELISFAFAVITIALGGISPLLGEKMKFLVFPIIIAGFVGYAIFRRKSKKL